MAVHVGSVGETADGGDDALDSVAGPAGPITTFLSFFYVNTKKGKNPVTSLASDVTVSTVFANSGLPDVTFYRRRRYPADRWITGGKPTAFL